MPVASMITRSPAAPPFANMTAGFQHGRDVPVGPDHIEFARTRIWPFIPRAGWSGLSQ
jgi:hypothetical protein